MALLQLLANSIRILSIEFCPYHMFIDEVSIYVRSGDGGDGCVSFRHEKFAARGGPDGGNGGKGASIIIRCDKHLNNLLQYKYKRKFIGQNGQPGMGSNCSGKSRPPMILTVPQGTQVFMVEQSHQNELIDQNQAITLLCDLIEDGQEFEVVTGGKGGLGNSHFRSSINRAPCRNTKGESGQEMFLCLHLKLLADVGIIGMPNAGKSTILSRITNAKPKIADYPFTTLQPNLGLVRSYDEEFLVADIPGLISGASEGCGLGDRFLKHIERCNVLLHVIDATAQDVMNNYNIIRKELLQYADSLTQKKEIIVLNKIDAIEPDELERKSALFLGKEVIHISCFTGENIDAIIKALFLSLKAS